MQPYLEEAVVLAQLHGLLPSVVALVQVGRDAAELDQLVLLEALRQRDVVKVVKRLDGRPHPLVVLLVNEEVVQCLVDGFVVVVLHGAQVWLDQGQVVELREEVDRACVVHARGQHQQQVVEQHGLVVQVEL